MKRIRWLKKMFYINETEKVTEKIFLRAMISSVLGIILCTVCLAGMTWAWFSDSVTNRSSTITSANFSVEVTVKKGTDNTKILLTNGKYVQDPEVDDYNDNIIARAENKTIADTKDAWQEISIPFTYAKDKETPKAALVTISTCAEPGGGSKNSKDPDILYVDDVELVYNAGFKSVSFNNEELTDFDESGNINIEKYDKKVKPEDFTIVAEGAGAYVTKKITADDEATYVTITVTSNDLKTFVTRTVTFPGLVNGINKPQTVTLPNGINAIYNLAGQQVSSMTSGNVYIVKTTDGKTKKVIKK